MGKKNQRQLGRKKKNSRKDDEDDDAIEKDERFAAAYNRPQFRHGAVSSSNHHLHPSSSSGGKTNSNNKIVLDERFASVLTDSRFRIQEQDKYGRSNKKKKKKKKGDDDDNNDLNHELDAFYTIEKKEKQTTNDAKEKSKDDAADGDGDDDTVSSSSSGSSSRDDKDKNKNEEEEDQDPASRISYLTALSRGELDVSSSSSSDDDDDSDDDSDQSSDDDDDDDSDEGGDNLGGTVGILDPSYTSTTATTSRRKRKQQQEQHEGEEDRDDEDVEITYEESPFLAVTNLDWSHVRAVDILAIVSSFAPPGSVKRVQVFVSDFGKEKMAHEIQYGPPSLWKKKKKDQNNKMNDKSEDEDDDESNNSNASSSSSSVDGGKEKNDSEDEDDDVNDDSDVEEEDYEGMDEEAYAKFLETVKEQQQLTTSTESDFDPEKLRAYEASKLRYYFAVAEFDNPAAADCAYKEVDGMEFEHSSAAVDMRSIPVDAIDDVVTNRELRDEATTLPSNYIPPDFIVSALQQTNVRCSWEAGDSERERMLTKYNNNSEQWASMAENNDLKAYLASDNSSSDDDDDDDDDSDDDGKSKKGAKLRKLLGLDADDSDENDSEDGHPKNDDSDDSDNDEEGREDVSSKEIRYVPGKADLQEKIRTKLQSKKVEDDKDATNQDLTPWEKYQQKRKEKRKERRQAARRKRSDIEMEGTGGSSSDYKTSTTTNRRQADAFFMDEADGNARSDSDDDEGDQSNQPSKEELELLLAGEDDEEIAKDFDMRGLRRIEKNKNKKLSKSRKRKEEKRAANVSGQDFAIDLKDSRFAAVLDGDDGRFGIDRTDPQYKETPAMKEILDEQKARRKKKKRKKNPGGGGGVGTTGTTKVPPNVVEGSGLKNAGSAALSSLVKSLKTKVATN